MIAARRFAFLPLVALAALALSLWTSDSGFAIFAAGVSALLAGAFLILVVVERTRWSRPSPPRFEADPLVLLARSFRSGRLGRQAILARLDGLDWAIPFDPAQRGREESEMIEAPEPRFLQYVDRRITEVEGRT